MTMSEITRIAIGEIEIRRVPEMVIPFRNSTGQLAR